MLLILNQEGPQRTAQLHARWFLYHRQPVYALHKEIRNMKEVTLMRKMIILFSLAIMLATIGTSGFGLNWFQIYIAAPLLLSILLVLVKTKNSKLNLIVSSAGLFSGILALVPYYSSYTYTGSDGQSALIYAVMPFYQLAFMLVVAAITWHITGQK